MTSRPDGNRGACGARLALVLGTGALFLLPCAAPARADPTFVLSRSTAGPGEPVHFSIAGTETRASYTLEVAGQEVGQGSVPAEAGYAGNFTMPDLGDASRAVVVEAEIAESDETFTRARSLQYVLTSAGTTGPSAPEPAPVLAPEPMPVLPEPLEPGSGAGLELGPVPVVLGEEVVPPTVLPVEAPALAPPVAPVVMPSSFRHCSRSVPMGIARHLLLLVLALPVAPPEALPDVSLEALLAPPEALPLVSLFALPLIEPPPAVAPTLAPVDPEALPAAPLCAAATPASAKSAAAVAVLTSFNIIGVPSDKG